MRDAAWGRRGGGAGAAAAGLPGYGSAAAGQRVPNGRPGQGSGAGLLFLGCPLGRRGVSLSAVRGQRGGGVSSQYGEVSSRGAVGDRGVCAGGAWDRGAAASPCGDRACMRLFRGHPWWGSGPRLGAAPPVSCGAAGPGPVPQRGPVAACGLSLLAGAPCPSGVGSAGLGQLGPRTGVP